MRILIISQYYPPDLGGSTRRVSNAVEGLKQRGHDIDVITAFPHYPLGEIPPRYKKKLITIERTGTCRIIRVWVPPIAHIGFARRLLMYLLFSLTSLLAIPVVRKPDVIWAANPSVFSSFPGLIYSLLRRAPIVRNVDDLWPEAALQQMILNSKLTKIGEAAAKIAYHLCGALTPISKGYCKSLVQKYAVPLEKLHVVEVGVDTRLFERSSGKSEKKSDVFTIVYSGLLGVGYDFETVLNAAEALHEDHSIHFLIRGIGEREHMLRRHALESGLDNLTISTDLLQIDQLVGLLVDADALILPMMPFDSHDAGVPTKLLEYMSCGRPIICGSRGESARIVENAKCGIVYPPSDSRSLVEAIQKLKDSPFKEEMGQNGRLYAEQNYSLDIIASKLERAFLYAMSK